MAFQMGNILLMLYVGEIRLCVIWRFSKAYHSICNVVMASLICLRFFMTGVIFVPSRWTKDPQEKMPLFQISDQRT